MFSVRLISERNGKPVAKEKVFVTYGFVPKCWKEEWTDNQGDAHFDVPNDAVTEVRYKGKTLHKGKVSGRVVAYI